MAPITALGRARAKGRWSDELTSPDQVQINHLFVHAEHLISRVPYFATALNNTDSLEAREQKFSFDNIDSEVIGTFVHWVYHDTLGNLAFQWEEPMPCIELALGLHRFAVHIDLASLQQMCLNMFTEVMVHTLALPDWDIVENHYENSMEGDAMRAKMIDYVAAAFAWERQLDGWSWLSEGTFKGEVLGQVLCRVNELSAKGDDMAEELKLWLEKRDQRSRGIAEPSAA